MSAFEYDQFCPVARAAEILGERWTLLIVRDLLLGPKRFSDLKARLAGISTSILSSRLAQLEQRGIVSKRLLPPPAASNVYELTASGIALKPTLIELARWGVRFLTPRGDEHFEPDWVVTGLMAFAKREATPELSIHVVIKAEPENLCVWLSGGAKGLNVDLNKPNAVPPNHTMLSLEPGTLLALISRNLDTKTALAQKMVSVDGPISAYHKLPDLFDLDTLGGRG